MNEMAAMFPHNIKWVERSKRCDICGGLDPMYVFTKFTNGFSLPYYKCKQCGVLFLSPCMAEDSAEAYYESGNYRKFLGENEGDGAVQTLRADHATQKFVSYPHKTGDKFLDVGCANGMMLRFMHSRAYDVTGVEPDPKDRQLCQDAGYNVFESSSDLADANGDGEIPQFKWISMIHVLEHQAHPLAFLNTYKDMLDYEGLMYIEVPNADSDPAAFLIHHPMTYNYKSLSYLITKIMHLDIVDNGTFSVNSPVNQSLWMLVRKI